MLLPMAFENFLCFFWGGGVLTFFRFSLLSFNLVKVQDYFFKSLKYFIFMFLSILIDILFYVDFGFLGSNKSNRKLSKLDEPDMGDTTGEVGTIS